MKNNEFKCAVCKEIYTKSWTDEEANKEAVELFGSPKEDWQSGYAVVCDDCFKKLNIPKGNYDKEN
mgnify:FL=1